MNNPRYLGVFLKSLLSLSVNKNIMCDRYTPENNLTMNPKAKKILFIALIAVDVALTVFLFVVSIIMLATLPEYAEEIDPTTFIGYFQANSTVFLLVIVVPLFALLIANIVALVFYLRKNKQKKVELTELSEEEKEALRRELMKDLAGDAKKEEEKEEKKEDIK